MSRFGSLFAGLALFLGPAAQAAPVPAGGAPTFAPMFTARLAPLDQILGDIHYTAALIARLAPSDKEAREFLGATDEFLKTTLGPDWRNGVDSTRPIFAYATLNPVPGSSNGVVVVMVPVKDQTAFLAVIARLAGKTTPGPEGVLQFDVPALISPSADPCKGFLRVFNRYAYLTLNDPGPIAPSRVPSPDQVEAGDPAAGLSARAYLERIPAPFRDLAVSGVQRAGVMLDAGPQGPTPAWGIAVSQLFLLGGPVFRMVPLAEPAIRDGRELTLNLRFDRKQLNLEAEAVLTAKAGSELSRSVAAIKAPVSLFPQIVGPEMAARGILRSTIPEGVRKQLEAQLQSSFTALPQADAVWGAFAVKLGESLLPTVREGEFDLAVGLAGPGKNDHYGAIAGLRVKDGAGVERAFRDAVKALPQNDQALFKLDVATAAGVKVHQVPPQPAALKPTFGDPTLHVAFAQDRVIFALGEGGLGLLEKALRAVPQPLPEAFVEVSAQKLVPLVTKIDAEAGRKYKAFLGTEIERVPLLRVALEGGSTLRVRYGNMFTSLATVGLFTARAVAVPGP